MDKSTAALFALFTIFTPSVANYTVIIIGSGASGVAAASKLLENNISNILILEAESRYGGRINSVFFGDAYVELGAQWCHGKTDNVAYDLANNLGLLEESFTKEELVYSRGKLDDDFKEKVNMTLMETFFEEPLHENVSMQDFYVTRYEHKIREIFKDEPNKLKIGLFTIRLFQNMLKSYEGAFSLSNVTSKSDFERGDYGDFNLKGRGMKTILEILIKKFPDESKALPFFEKLLLNKKIVKIRWNESETVAVEVEGGSVYHGKYVIFTPSLNVLKHDHEKIFEPGLPQNKVKALELIGMDAVMKLHLRFTEKWWYEDFNGHFFIWDNEDDLELQEKGYPWVTSVFVVVPADYNSKVLSFWVIGNVIPGVELLSDEEVERGLMIVLEKFLGDSCNITKPEGILRSKWHTNPNFRGSYSYQTVEAKLRRPSPEVELAKPLDSYTTSNALCFAGEATSPHHYSTVHGAIESGFREAERIIKIYK